MNCTSRSACDPRVTRRCPLCVGRVGLERALGHVAEGRESRAAVGDRGLVDGDAADRVIAGAPDAEDVAQRLLLAAGREPRLSRALGVLEHDAEPRSSSSASCEGRPVADGDPRLLERAMEVLAEVVERERVGRSGIGSAVEAQQSREPGRELAILLRSRRGRSRRSCAERSANAASRARSGSRASAVASSQVIAAGLAELQVGDETAPGRAARRVVHQIVGVRRERGRVDVRRGRARRRARCWCRARTPPAGRASGCDPRADGSPATRSRPTIRRPASTSRSPPAVAATSRRARRRARRRDRPRSPSAGTCRAAPSRSGPRRRSARGSCGGSPGRGDRRRASPRRSRPRRDRLGQRHRRHHPNPPAMPLPLAPRPATARRHGACTRTRARPAACP